MMIGGTSKLAVQTKLSSLEVQTGLEILQQSVACSHLRDWLLLTIIWGTQLRTPSETPKISQYSMAPSGSRGAGPAIGQSL